MKNSEIHSLISNNSEQRILDYQNSMLIKSKDIDQEISKINIAMLITILTYTIVSKTKVTSIEIGPFTLSDFDIINKLTPLIFSYLLLQYSMLNSHKAEIHKAIKQLSAHLYHQPISEDEDMYDANFVRLLLPFSIWSEISKVNQTKSVGCLGLAVTIPGLIFIILIPFYFQYITTKYLITVLWNDPISKFTAISSIWINVCTVYIFAKLFQHEIKTAKSSSAS